MHSPASVSSGGEATLLNANATIVMNLVIIFFSLAPIFVVLGCGFFSPCNTSLLVWIHSVRNTLSFFVFQASFKKNWMPRLNFISESWRKVITPLVINTIMCDDLWTLNAKRKKVKGDRAKVTSCLQIRKRWQGPAAAISGMLVLFLVLWILYCIHQRFSAVFGCVAHRSSGRLLASDSVN